MTYSDWVNVAFLCAAAIAGLVLFVRTEPD